MADQFTAALEKAAGRGVQVNVVIDSIGASKMDKEHVERLRDAGCKVVDFNPSHWYALEDLNYRTHRKILVVDGEIDRYGQCHDRLGKSGRLASGASAMTPIGPAACRVNDLGEAGGYALVDQAMICEAAINCTIGSAIGGSLTSLVKIDTVRWPRG